jgi:hypothetical protein
MAINAAPFALKNQGLDAEPLRQAVASLVPNAGGLVQYGDLPVTQTLTPSLGVLVGVGRAWMPGNNTANLSGQTYSSQAQYFALNDANVTVNLSTANATNPRIDLIYIGALDSFYSGSTDLIKIDKVTGTPAASPAVPALPKNAIALAQVAVAANATSIVNANITYLAVPFWARHAEFTGTTTPPANTSWGVGNLVKDAANSPGGSGFVPNGADTITLPGPGMYSIFCRLKMSAAASGTTWASLRDGSGNEYTSYDIQPGNSAGTLLLPNLFTSVQQDLQFKFQTGASGTTLTTRIRIDKLN